MSEKDDTRLTAYQAYQANARKSEALQSEILRETKRGAPLAVMLMKAAEAISLMTDSSAFRDEIERALIDVYGFALADAGALAMEREAVSERLAKIEAAMERCTDEEQRHALDLAIRAHRQRLQEIDG